MRDQRDQGTSGEDPLSLGNPSHAGSQGRSATLGQARQARSPPLHGVVATPTHPGPCRRGQQPRGRATALGPQALRCLLGHVPTSRGSRGRRIEAATVGGRQDQ